MESFCYSHNTDFYKNLVKMIVYGMHKLFASKLLLDLDAASLGLS